MSTENEKQPTAIEAAELYRSVKDAREKLSALTGAEQVLLTRIRTAYRNQQQLAMLHILETTSVEELNSGGQGIPVATLKKAGYENVRQLAEMSVKQLDDLAGIGDSTLDKIILRVQEIARHAREVARVRVEERTRDTEALVRNVMILRETEELMHRAVALTTVVPQGFETLLSLMEPLTSPMSWRTLLHLHKQKSLDAWRILNAWRNSGAPEEILRIYGDFAEREKGLTADVCWESFLQNTAPVYAMLEKLVGDSGPVSQGLPEEVAREIQEFPLDTSLMVATLRNYQEFGTKYVLHQRRTLLGDEMGLGKTMQALAAMAHLKTEGRTHFLVVCTVSVLVNWIREIEKHTKLSAAEIYGNDRDEEFRNWIQEGGVAVTTFETVTKLAPPEGLKVDLLVVDEAHYVKNPEAERTRGLMRYTAVSDRVLFMTGTPLENRVDEMIFLISMLNSEKAEEIRGMKELSMAPEFREKIAPVYLRRTREDVLKELPEKVEKEEWCRLGQKELAEYRASLIEGNFAKVRRVSWNVQNIADSVKAQRLSEIAEQAREEGRKVLVFSFFLDTIARVQELLGDRVFGPISGSIPADRRQELVDQFAAGPDGSVLLCQIVAGGVGLNIQAASVVVICEPQWKPSIETQAISRVYRMGQARSVEVFRLLAENTVDEHVLQILKGKSEIFEGFADESSVGDASMDLLQEEEKKAEQAAEGGTGEGAPTDEEKTGKNIMAKILEAERKRYGLEEPSGDTVTPADTGEHVPEGDTVTPADTGEHTPAGEEGSRDPDTSDGPDGEN